MSGPGSGATTLPATMKAAVFHGPHDVRVEEVPTPDEIGPDEVLLRVDRSAICGTDLHPYEGHMDLEEGVVLGHEFLGTVIETGDAVNQVVAGDVCTCACAVSCGACYFCRRNEPGRCAGIRMFGMGMALGDLGGAQSEYVVVPYADRNLRKLPDDASDSQLDSLLLAGDIITTGYEAVKKAFRPGDVVAVVGAGPVGLCAVMSAGVLGASAVVAVDTVPERLKTAESLGATAVTPKEAEDAIADLTDWRGADVVVDAAGNPEALTAIAGYVRMGGTVSIPSVYLQDSLELPWGNFWLKGVNFTMGVTHFNNSMDDVIALIRAGRLDPGRIISHRMPLSEADEAYRLFAAREATKVILDPRS
ncbi:MAG TPA: alcohol dehydrogenase catalytic domain-containing protein [Acidimicrobiia bacterium]|nr:alcohol dehydrogenase catalytic domain-containing protein [Acidimicrobiia bacterium]